MTKTVSFTQMKDGTRADYALLDQLEQRYAAQLPNQILAALGNLGNSLGGYRITRLEHSLQTASRAENDGADEEMVAAALLHDLGDVLAPHNHSQYAASLIQPYVREEVTWVVAHHGLFQMYYYAHHIGGNANARERYRGHPWFETCEYFCEHWDQAAFDPHYPTRPITHFEPLVRRIFLRKPFDPEILNAARVPETPAAAGRCS